MLFLSPFFLTLALVSSPFLPLSYLLLSVVFSISIFFYFSVSLCYLISLLLSLYSYSFTSPFLYFPIFVLLSFLIPLHPYTFTSLSFPPSLIALARSRQREARNERDRLRQCLGSA